jgi:hypothetical protein
MPEMAVAGPLNQLKLPNQFRFQPPAIGHFLQREPGAPAPAVLLRQVCERALLYFQRVNLLEQFRRDAGVKPFRVRAAYISFDPS